MRDRTRAILDRLRLLAALFAVTAIPAALPATLWSEAHDRLAPWWAWLPLAVPCGLLITALINFSLDPDPDPDDTRGKGKGRRK